MRELADLRRVRGLSLTESFFELTRLRVLDVWTHLALMGYGVKDYFDFTDKNWVALPVERQIKYASEYQNWYAERLGEAVERSFEGIVFRLIPPGSYKMGSIKYEERYAPIRKQRKKNIRKPFWCGKYTVTQKEWMSVIGTDPSYFLGGNLPVESVSWNNCQDFCQNTGFQLPNEEQWEYACRGGTTTYYSFGNDLGLLDQYAHYARNSQGTHSVGEKLPNSWGLHDMHGNVWEATNSSPSYSLDGKISRGGCYRSASSLCFSSAMSWNSLSWNDSTLGFRVCKSI